MVTPQYRQRIINRWSNDEISYRSTHIIKTRDQASQGLSRNKY